jgi:hypothetical protein
MTREEIAANIVLSMMQKDEFQVLAKSDTLHDMFVESVCDAYKKVYKAIVEAEKSGI